MKKTKLQKPFKETSFKIILAVTTIFNIDTPYAFFMYK